MAATVSAWSKPGAWALDSEENEAELLQQNINDNNNNNNSKPLAAEFPSLATAAATKPKKKKGQTLSLAEFTAKPVYSLVHQDPVDLPTAPRQRTAEELERDRTKLGGGFRSYGGDRPNRNSVDSEGNEAELLQQNINDNNNSNSKPLAAEFPPPAPPLTPPSPRAPSPSSPQSATTTDQKQPIKIQKNNNNHEKKKNNKKQQNQKRRKEKEGKGLTVVSGEAPARLRQPRVVKIDPSPHCHHGNPVTTTRITIFAKPPPHRLHRRKNAPPPPSTSCPPLSLR